MVYFTGDIHGVPWQIRDFCKKWNLTADDIIVILGDVGANYYGDFRDDAFKRILDVLPPTILCIHGNHEMRPWNVAGYHLSEWNGGKVWVQEKFPGLLFAKDGEVLTINSMRYIAIGGAYSVDKDYRIGNDMGWWKDEQPSAEIKSYVEHQLKENKIDVILSHTCPYKYEPREAFLSCVRQETVDDSTERWLDTIEDHTDYRAWFCGHWHIDKRVDRMHFLFKGFESDDQFCRGNDTVS